ncbi:unnamed protein product, partial [marine sediment metagenome]
MGGGTGLGWTCGGKFKESEEGFGFSNLRFLVEVEVTGNANRCRWQQEEKTTEVKAGTNVENNFNGTWKDDT